MSISALRVAMDVSLVVLLPFFGAYIDNNWIPPRPGILCKDPRLSYPKKDNTISPRNVTIISGFLPIILFLIYGIFIHKRRWSHIYQTIVTYCVGIDMVFVTNNLVKYNLGWPRPYFLEACDPDYDKIDCDKGFTLEPQCRGDPQEIKWASLTFPSLHSSSTTFAVTFLLMFLYDGRRLRPSCYLTNMSTSIVTCVSITLCVFVALSRVNDHRHHVSDVIAGSLWGLVFAVIFYYFCPDSHDTKNIEQATMVQQREENDSMVASSVNKKTE